MDPVSVPGPGYLDLVYDADCRTIWARVPNGSIPDLWSQRSTAGGCLYGSTTGHSWYANGTYEWSKQLNDKNCSGRAHVYYGGNYYNTNYY